MSTFSECRSNNGKFHLKLEYSDENEPLKLFINADPPAGESVTVSDLTDAIYNCFVGGLNSFEIAQKTVGFPCEVRSSMVCRDIQISWFNSFDKALDDIASQITI